MPNVRSDPTPPDPPHASSTVRRPAHGGGPNVLFVLVRPQRAGNIGAAARALKNMGFARLALVAPAADPTDPEALRMAYGAQEVLTRARVFPTLAAAVARCRYVVGTTARVHRGYGPPADLAALAPEIRRRADRGRVAILFGPEASGLANDEIALCQRLVAIAAAPRHASLNLAQAVMVVAYELARPRAPGSAGRRAGMGGTRRAPPDSAQRERFHSELTELLGRIGFVRGRQGRHIVADLRRIFTRAELDARELRILRGLLRQLHWALGRAPKP